MTKLLDKYDKVQKQLSEFHQTMTTKYQTLKWNEKCTDNEWNEFITLIRQKDKLETKLAKEEEL